MEQIIVRNLDGTLTLNKIYNYTDETPCCSDCENKDKINCLYCDGSKEYKRTVKSEFNISKRG